MGSKILGFLIIGTVLTLGIAVTSKTIVQKYNDYTVHLIGEHMADMTRQELARIYSQSQNLVNYEKKTFNLVDEDEVFWAIIYLGLVVMIVVIQQKLRLAKVYRYMTYSLLFSLAFGVLLGFIFAKDWRYDTYNDCCFKAMMWQFGGELLIANCLYFGLGAAALIYGIHLTTKTNKQ